MIPTQYANRRHCVILALFLLLGLGSDAIATRDPDLEAGFPVQTLHLGGTYCSDQSIFSLVADIDGDSSPEIMVSGLALGPLYAWKANGSPAPSWPVGGFSGAFYPSAGKLSHTLPGWQVFTGNFNTELAAYEGSGSILPGWPKNSITEVCTPAALSDVDGDGLDEIFVGQGRWEMYAYKADGTPLPGWPISYFATGGLGASTPAIADLDGDGKPEIVFGTGSESSSRCEGGYPCKFLYAYHIDGTIVNGFPIRNNCAGALRPVIGDIDGDQSPELVVASSSLNCDWQSNGTVWIFSPDGNVKRTITASGPISFASNPALADMDGDGTPEIIVQSETGLGVWRGDGSVFPGWPVKLLNAAFIGNSAPVVGDVDGDNLPEIVVIAVHCGGNCPATVHVLERNGIPNSHFPKTLDFLGSGGVPAIADIDLDGRNEIIIVGDYWDGYSGYRDKVWIYDLGGPPHGRIEWGQYGGGPKHQAYYQSRGPIAPEHLYLPFIRK